MRGISAYQENSLTAQPPGRIIVMLYGGAIKFLRQAIAETEAENWGEKGACIAKAQAIVDELNACLDMEDGGEIAQNLRSLYLFMRKQLTRANIDRDAKLVQEIISLLEELNEGWKTITE